MVTAESKNAICIYGNGYDFERAAEIPKKKKYHIEEVSDLKSKR